MTAPYWPYSPGSAGTAGDRYLVPVPRTAPARECADPDEPGRRRRVAHRERAAAEEER